MNWLILKQLHMLKEYVYILGNMISFNLVQKYWHNPHVSYSKATVSLAVF